MGLQVFDDVNKRPFVAESAQTGWWHHDPHFAVAQVLITHHDTGGWHEGMWQVTPVDHITNANTGEGASRCIVFYENLLGPFGGGAGFIGWRDVAVVFLWHD